MFVFVSLIGAGVASAQTLWEPENLGDGRAYPIVMVASELIPSIRIGNADITLNRTPIADATRRFNSATGQRGDANEHLEWLCLTGRDGRGRWILWLESGEIHGDRVGAFQVRRLAAEDRVDARCGSISASLRNPAGLNLEMSRQDVRTILGGANSSGPTVTFVHERQEANGLDVQSIVTVSYRQDVVIAFEVWRTETN